MRSPRPSLGSALLYVLLTVQSSLGQDPATAQGRRIAAVEIRLAASEIFPYDPASLLAFAPGDLFNESAARRTLSNFYATGLIAEAEVLTRPSEADGNGVVVLVALVPQTLVARVEVVGELGIKESELEPLVEQEEDGELSEAALLRSVYALQEIYARRGYLGASVRLEVEEPTPYRAVVRFRVASGPRAAIGHVTLTGIKAVDAPDLLDALRVGPGAPYDRRRLDTDVERLRQALAKRGFLQAQVGDAREEIDREAHRVHLSYPIETGPQVDLEVRGAEVEKLEKKGLLPFLDAVSYDAALLSQSREDLRAHFQRKGHYRVDVQARELARDDHLTLELIVDRGPVYRLTDVRFEGNHQLTDEALRRLVATAPRRFLSPGSGRLVAETVREDLANLRSFYALQGFFEAEVGPERVILDGEELSLEIPIREGRRRRVVELDLRGVRQIDADALLARLPLRPGGPFHPVLLDEALSSVRAVYEEAGYPSATVTPHLDWNPEQTLVDVTLEVDERQLLVVDRVLLRGARRTRPEILDRLIDLEPGEPISRRRLLEVERDLYRLGIFSGVNVELAPVAELSGKRDVRVELDEGSRYRIGYGVSYHSDEGLGGLLSLSRINLRGRGDRLQLDLRGNERDRRFRLLYSQPFIGRFDVPVTYTLFRQDEERESFDLIETGAQITLARQRRSARFSLVYDYRLVELSTESIDPGVIDRQNRDLQISSLTPQVFLEHRDNPLDPQRGWSALWQLEYAFPFLGADTELIKLFVQQTAYQPLDRWGVLAASVRFGAIEPLNDLTEGDPLVPRGLASAQVPASERFFAGGRTTHRAYERDQLGIVGETLFPSDRGFLESGGNGLVLLNFDYRFPIAGAVGGTLFADVGNVWADWRDIDVSELKTGVGIGVRYNSPIGPLRFEVGWKLDREPGEDSPVFFLSFGNPF